MTLLNDFADLREIHGPGEGRSWPEDEKNLLYVAITRAKNNLMMNNLVRDEIIGNDGLHRLITFRRGDSPARPLVGTCRRPTCGQENCNRELSKDLHRPQLLCRIEDYKLSSGVYHEGVGLGGLNSHILRLSKLYCTSCSLEVFPWFREFFYDDID